MFGNNEKKEMLEAEKRGQQFMREQTNYDHSNRTDEIMAELAIKHEKEDLLKWQQDLEPELMDLVYKLRGWILVNGEWLKPSDCKPLCNDLFINKIVVPSCKPFLCRNMLNTNLSEERILFELRNVSDNICDNMVDGYDIYDIDFIDYDIVLSDIKTTIIPGAFRALNGWTKKTDSTIFKRIESTFDHQEENKNRKVFGFGR